MIPRADELDRLRGLAIACMIGDHLALVTGGPAAIRWTVGRLAMPLFFVVAGHLVRRVTARQLQVGLVGVLLPAVVPWVDQPNVLVMYAVGALLLVVSRRVGPAGPAGLGVLALGVAANLRLGTGYPPAVLVALMVAGHYLPRRWLVAVGGPLPHWLAVLGRRPMTWYLGHLLILRAAQLVVAS